MSTLVGCEAKEQVMKGLGQGHSALEHEFEEETIVREATCKKDGLKTSKCECGAVMEEKIPAFGHQYDWVTKEKATCGAAELLEGTCKVCSHVKTKKGDAKAHPYQWTSIKAATCETGEVLEGKCSCGKTMKKTTKALGHSVGEYEIIKPATTEKEGVLEAVCANGCGKTLSLKIMKTPKVTRKNVALSWDKVSGAAGYRLYLNGKLHSDLGSVTSCKLPVYDATSYKFEVEAYSNKKTYFEVSNKSTAINLSVSFGNNMQASRGTDFDLFNKPIELGASWSNHYSNYSEGQVTVINENGNGFAKLYPISNSGYATVTHAADTKVLKAGTYVISMDVKLGSAVDGTLAFGIWDGVSWSPEWRTQINLAKANAGAWTTVSCEYTITADKTGDYANVDIGYQALKANVNNYILVDNIKIVKKGSTTNLDADRNNGFEDWFSLSTPGWKSNGVRDVIYIREDMPENSLVTIGDNVALKFYSSRGKGADAILSGNTAVYTEGIYKCTMKVKLGPDATKFGPAGIRIYNDAYKPITADSYFVNVDKANPNDWVTLETIFVVNATGTTSYIQYELFVYTHNDKILSPDNYVLVDDFEVYKVNIE